MRFTLRSVHLTMVETGPLYKDSQPRSQSASLNWTHSHPIHREVVRLDWTDYGLGAILTKRTAGLVGMRLVFRIPD